MSQPPLTPYSYAQSLARRDRPGSVTLVGVLGIVVGILGLFFGVIGSAVSYGYSMAGERHNNLIKITVPAPVAVPKVQENPRGLTEAQVDDAVAGLARRMPMPPQRTMQVRNLMRSYGKDILLLGDSISSGAVERLVSECGPMMPASQYYELGTGRVEVSDRQAIFRPTDPSGQTLRSSDVVNDRSLSEDQILAVIDMCQQMDPFEGQLSGSQSNALRTLLRDPNQSAVTFNGNMPILLGVWHDTTSTLVIRTATCQIRVPQSGPATIMPANMAVASSSVFASSKPFNRSWPKMGILDSMLAIPIAIFLIVASSLLLRGRPIGRTMCLWTAVGKLLLAILGAFIWGRLVYEIAQASNARPTDTPIYPALGLGMLALVLGLVYPAVTLMVLMGRGAKEYFRGVM